MKTLSRVILLLLLLYYFMKQNNIIILPPHLRLKVLLRNQAEPITRYKWLHSPKHLHHSMTSVCLYVSDKPRPLLSADNTLFTTHTLSVRCYWWRSAVAPPSGQTCCNVVCSLQEEPTPHSLSFCGFMFSLKWSIISVSNIQINIYTFNNPNIVLTYNQ